MKPPKNAATLVDVAREAGVSLKTASRVLNSEAYVNADTAERVRNAMAKLAYRPNELARGLKARKSAAIGMIVPNLSDPFAASAAMAVQEVAKANGYVLFLANSGGYVDVERSEVESLVGRQIDGLVIAPADGRKSHWSDIIPADLPVVTFDQPIRNSSFDAVTVPNRRSAKEATQHLLSHGYRKIVAIGARPHIYTCAERIAGYRDAVRGTSVAPLICTVEHEGLLNAEWLRTEVIGRHKPDAIFSLNWVCTMLTLRALRQLHIKAGKQLPFLSFDDFSLADMLEPALTAVRQPSEMLGRAAANLLFERLKHPDLEPAKSLVLPTSLIVRESCGCVEG